MGAPSTSQLSTHTHAQERGELQRESTSTSSLLAGRGRRLGTAAAAASLVGVGALLAAVLREGERTESVVSLGAAAPPFGGQERRKGPLLYCTFASSHRTPRLSSLPLFSVYPLFLSLLVGGWSPAGRRRRRRPPTSRGARSSERKSDREGGTEGGEGKLGLRIHPRRKKADAARRGLPHDIHKEKTTSHPTLSVAAQIGKE